MTATALYDCVVRHQRRSPVRYGLRQRVFYWLVDLDRLPQLPRALRPLARFQARDHIGDPRLPLRANVEALAAQHGIDLAGGRIWMLTQPRILGYVFNPLTVYWCHTADGTLACVVAEVHNTYGQRHAYVLPTIADGPLRTDKRLYVSPFHDLSGTYHMRMPEPDQRLALAIRLETGASRPFTATLTGRALPPTTANLLRMTARRPWQTLFITAGIRWHAIRLLIRGLRVVPRSSTQAQP